MVSAKIHCAVAVAAVLFVSSLLPASHASTANHVSVAPAPAPVYISPPPPPSSRRIQPVVIVQGVIYCKSCKLRGYNPYMDASPLPNATTELVCYGEKELNLTSTVSDKNGYFLVMVYSLDKFRAARCRVYLRSSPTPLCSAAFIPSQMWLGLPLEREKVVPVPKGVRGVYRPKSVLMFQPDSSGKCPAELDY